jgi:CBS domain containing-hemolysin-like protein
MLIDFMARRVFGLSGKEVLTPIVTEEELLTIVNVGEEEGVIQPEEREMIEDIITFGDTIVREVMTPRVDIIGINANAPFNEALALVTTHGHSRIPVYRESNDRIIGLLYAKDLLLGMRYGNTDFVVAEMMRAPYYVPEMINIGVLLRTMQSRRVHFAVVVDEYGSTTGIITLEDILEEIVGEINDEYDQNRDPDVVWNGDGDVIVDARLLLDDVNDLTGLALQSETSDRIGGFVTEQLGRMSQLNDEVQVDGATMTVVAMNGIRMSRIRIVYTPKQGGKGDSSNQPVATD